MNEQQLAEYFAKWLLNHTHEKAKLYDGSDQNFTPDTALRFAAEELGEIASEITRKRWIAASYECMDLAHCAFLLWLSIHRIVPPQSTLAGQGNNGT